MEKGIYGSRYKLLNEIGAGVFGEIFRAEDLETGEFVAIKLEKLSNGHVPMLQEEKNVYKDLEGGHGIPSIKWFGQEKGYNVLVMDLLGPSLQKLHDGNGKMFSKKTILMLADQMLRRIEYIHSKYFIHRDIKPDNFVMGIGEDRNKVFLIDFGVSVPYWDFGAHNHLPDTKAKANFVGNARFASINAHRGQQQSRRDDMEAIGYVLVYFLRGNLPWQMPNMGKNRLTNKKNRERICEKKLSTSIEELCSGCEPEFAIFIKYCRNLGFEETPDYKYARLLFYILFRSLNYKNDNFDWKLK